MRVGVFHDVRGFLMHAMCHAVMGAGTLTGANGNKYVGEFKDGNYHGRGMSCARGDKSRCMGSDGCSPRFSGFFFLLDFKNNRK